MKSLIAAGVDKECMALCAALNQLDGITTVESCCGHGSKPYRIWFFAEEVNSLLPVLYWTDWCHCGYRDWEVKARTDCSMDHVSFMVEGPKGRRAYKEAFGIARLITEYVRRAQYEDESRNAVAS